MEVQTSLQACKNPAMAFSCGAEVEAGHVVVSLPEHVICVDMRHATQIDVLTCMNDCNEVEKTTVVGR